VAKKKEELMLDYLLRQEHFKRDLVFGKKTSAQDVSEARKAILEEVGQLVAAAQGRNKTHDLYKIVAQAFVKHVQKARHKKFLQELNTKYDRQVQLIEANRAAEGRTRVPHSPRKPIPVSGINKEVSAKLVVSKAQRFCERMQAIVDSLKDNNGRLDVLTQEQGFFRTGGSEKIVNQIVKNWSKNQDISVKALRNLDVKDRSTLIKRLIRDFPGLLLGANMSELKKVLCGPSKSAQEKHQAIEQHLSKLPVANQEFLELLMELCLFVETHKEQTSMTAENLVTSVLGSLFDDWTEPIDTMLVVKDIVDRKEAAQALFDYYKNLQITQTTLQEIR